MTFWLFVAVLVGASAGLGWVAGAHARSVAVGVLSGVLTLAAAAAHTLHGLVLGLSEEPEPLRGYDALVSDLWFPLLVVYMALPPLLVTAAHRLTRGRRARAPRRAPQR